MFARDGARVYASARREERLAALAQEMTAEGHNLVYGTSDASTHESMVALAEDAVAKLGGVDIVVYVTGTNTPNRALTRLTREIWNELIEVNLNGAFSLTSALLPAMRDARKGHFIYVSSISSTPMSLALLIRHPSAACSALHSPFVKRNANTASGPALSARVWSTPN